MGYFSRFVSKFFGLSLCAVALLLYQNSVWAASPGDANGDSEVNGLDAVYLVTHMYSAWGPAPEGDCDFDHDSEITEGDVEELVSRIYSAQDLASSQVGPEGGTIEAGGFSMTVPAGALTGNHTIGVEVRDSDSGMEGQSTKIYSLTGLPEELSAEVEISLPLEPAFQTQAQSYEQSSLVKTSAIVDNSLQTNDYVMLRSFQLSISPRQIKETLYHSQAVKQIKNGVQVISTKISELGAAVNERLELFGADGQSHYTPINGTGHFNMIMTKEQAANHLDTVKEIYAYLEALYAELATVLDMPWSTNPFFIRVRFVKLSVDGYSNTSKWAQFADYLEINESFLATGMTTELKRTLAHELLHLLQANYDPRWLAQRRNLEDALYEGNLYLWLNEAVSTWAEDRFTTPRKVPNLLLINFQEPYYALHKWEDDKSKNQDHGYGMAGLIKEIAESCTGCEKIIGRMYKDMYNYWFWEGGKHPVEALMAAVNPNKPEDLTWWRYFFISYIQESIYEESLNSALGTYVEGKGDVIYASPSVSDQDLTSSQTDLSARPYLIDFSTGEVFGSNQSMTFTTAQAVDGYMRPKDSGLMVFKMPRTGQTTWIAGDGIDEILTVSGLDVLQSEKARLLVLLFNNRHERPYTDKNDYYFAVSVGSPNLESPIKSSKITGTVSGLKNVWEAATIQSTKGYLAHFPDPEEEVTLDITMQTTSACTAGTSYSFVVEVFGAQETRNGVCPATESLTVSNLYDPEGDTGLFGTCCIGSTCTGITIAEALLPRVEE